MKSPVLAGTLARSPGNALLIMGRGFDTYSLKQTGMSDTGIMWYDEVTPVKNWTPELCQDIKGLLPKALWYVCPYTAGLTGTDPEVFAFTNTDKPIPAWRYLPTSTKKPMGETICWDGVQAEFTIAPNYCHNFVCDKIQEKLRTLYKLVRIHDKTATLKARDVVRLDMNTLQTANDEHIMLGCSPSRNAYESVEPIHVGDPRQHVYRYAGTHLHHSLSDYGHKPKWFPNGTVVMMDKIAGILLTALGRDMEDPKRRIAYGRAGEYRLPSQDNLRLEYRTPGAYLLHHPALFNFGADMARSAYRMGLLMDGNLLPDIGDVQPIINNCDADTAVAIMKANRNFFEHIWEKQNGYNYNVAATWDTVTKGALASGRFANSLVSNWCIDGRREWSLHNEQNDCKWTTHVV